MNRQRQFAGMLALLVAFPAAEIQAQDQDRDADDRRARQEERRAQRERERDTQQEPAMEAEAGDELARAKALIGAKFFGEGEKELGVIEDLIFDLEEGQVAYAVLSFDESQRDYEDGLYAVPWRSLLPAESDQVLLLETDPRYFDQRNRFPEDKWPDFKDQQWGAVVHQRFDVEPYWEVHRYFDSTHGEMASGGWGATSKFELLFKPRLIERFEGEVVDVNRVKPMTGMEPGIAITMRADGGERTVHLGPAWYFERQEFEIAPGDQVTVHAAPAQLEGEEMYIAARIRSGRTVLALRDQETGIPAWSAWQSERAVAAAEGEAEGQQQGRLASRREVAPGEIMVRASEFLETDLEGAQGGSVGSIEDALIDRNSGKIAYLIIADASRTEARNVIPVPWDALNPNPRANNVVIEMTRRELAEAPTVPSNELRRLNNLRLSSETHKFFGVRPNWFLDRRLASAGSVDVSSDLQQHLEFARSAPVSDKTFTGRVLDVRYWAPAEGVSDAMLLIMEDQGARKHIYLGPNWFMEHQNILIKRGDRIEVVGGIASAQGGNYVVASRVEVGNQLLTLRNDEGQFMWDAVSSQGGRSNR